MLEAAVAASAGELALVGVTVLTSHDAASYEQALGRTSVTLAAEVERLGQLAIAAGLQGLVCSPSEVSVLRQRLGPKPFLVVPGIRRGSDAWGDQVRVSSPEDAIRHGATHLVVGRPVLQAANPRAVLEELMKEAGCVIS